MAEVLLASSYYKAALEIYDIMKSQVQLSLDEEVLRASCQIQSSQKSNPNILQLRKGNGPNNYTAKEYYWAGVEYRKLGRYEQAENNLLLALPSPISIDIKTCTHEQRLNLMSYPEADTIVVLTELSYIYHRQEMADQAASYGFKAYQLVKELHGEDTLSFEMTNVSAILVSVYDGKKFYRKAKHYALKYLEMSKQYYGSQHRNIAIAMQNVGWCFQQICENERKGNHTAREHNRKRAQDHYLKAISMYKSLDLGRTTSMANSLHSLGDCYRSAGKISDAFDCYRESKKLFGDIAPERRDDIRQLTEKLKELEDKADHLDS